MNQPKLQIDIIQREHKVIRLTKWTKGDHVKLQRECKVTELSVNMFACVSWYSINGQTDLNCHNTFTACAATGDQPTVYEESQPVTGVKIESYILAPFSNTLTFSGQNHAKKAHM